MSTNNRTTARGETSRRTAELVGSNRELVYRFRWNATQVVVIAIGILLMALGGIGLARAGAAGFIDVFNPDVAVGPWHRTPLMAVIELGIGLTLIVSGAQRVSPRSLYRVAGALGLVFGIVLIGAPSAFDSALGASRATGWLYAVLGVVFLSLGFGAPIVFERERVSAIDEEVEGEPAAAVEEGR